MKTSFSNRNRLTAVILLVALAPLCAGSTAPPPSRADGSVRQDGQEKKEYFTDEDLKVEIIKGRWSAQSDFDEKQLNDPSVPVYVKGINMFWGKGKYLGRMKIPEVVLENRSPGQTSSVRLGWTIVSQDDPDIVLLEGVTPMFDARVNPYSAARVDIPEIYFNKILKPLRKEGELNGGFRLVLGVREVRFSTPSPSWAEASVRQDGQEKKEYFTDEDLKVEKIPGKWKLGSLVDVRQGNDPSVPVVVAAFKTVYGQGKYLGRVKVPELRIENRSQKILQSVQLRWAIANYNEPDTILLEGVLPFIDVRIEPFSPPLHVNIAPVYFNKVVRPLLKDGELNFHVLLTVGVQEARFADGSVWRRTPQAAFLRTSLLSLTLSSELRYFKPTPFIDISLWRWPPRPESFPCTEEPRAFALGSSVSSLPNS